MLDYAASIRQLIAEERSYYHASQRDKLTDQDICRHKCVGFTEKLAKLHPELTLQAGFVHFKTFADQGFKGSEHWWCLTPEGQIIDPSVAQFGEVTEANPLVYTPFNPDTHKIIIGKCMNCGWEIYGLEAEGPLSVCRPQDNDTDQDCEAELRRYYAKG